MAVSSGFSIPACLGALRSSELFKPPDPAASTQISLDLFPSPFQLLCFSAVCNHHYYYRSYLGLRVNKTKY